MREGHSGFKKGGERMKEKAKRLLKRRSNWQGKAE